MKTERGLYGKYRITKADGSPVNSFKFVLSPEKDPAALEALKTYAKVTTDEELSVDLGHVIGNIQMKPERECPGCAGHGKFYAMHGENREKVVIKCSKCEGTGKIQEKAGGAE